MREEQHHRWMERALHLAQRGWGRVAPNPMVGAVVVRDGRIVGEGFHLEYGKPHAEVEALRAAGDLARGASLYVTLEPCAHHGKTPPCTDAILAAGIQRVVYARADPNGRAAGGGRALERAGIAVTKGVLQEEATELNAAFLYRFSARAATRPWVELKLALSLDARIADADGRSSWITGEAARGEVHRMRAGHDAIAVGIGTVLADDPQLTVRGEVTPRVPPVRIVFDRQLRLPLHGKLLRSAADVPVWVVCAPDADAERRKQVEQTGARLVPAADLDSAMAALRDSGINSVLCEGGAALAGSLLRGRFVDRLHLFYAPLFLGPSGVRAFAGVPGSTVSEAARWRQIRTQPFGADTLISLAP